MKGPIVPILALFLLVRSLHALPLFEIANQYDRQGNTCPLRSKANVACPLLCVTDHSQCPPSLAPSCPPGLLFCNDGTCQSSCGSIPNACMCDSTLAASNYLPCAAGQMINITHFDPTNQVAQTQTLCATNAQIQNVSQTSAWGSLHQSPVWLTCPVPPDPTFSFLEPMWVVVWSFTVWEAILLALWHLYKTTKEAKFHRENKVSGSYKTSLKSPNIINEKSLSLSDMASHDSKEKLPRQSVDTILRNDGDSNIDSHKESDRLLFRGFHANLFGFLAFGSVVVVSLLFLVFLGCLVSDNYGQLSGAEQPVFLTSDMSSKIFCAVWHISAAWFSLLLLKRKHIRNYFRIESYAYQCAFVQVERRQEEIVFLNDGNTWTARISLLEQQVVKRLGMDILVDTCPVYTTENKLGYFEYQCMRYVLNTEKKRFEPYTFQLGSTNSEIHAWSKGHTTTEAKRRQDFLGPNIIPVIVPSVFWAIVQEFSSFIYLYQMMCMWVWYYFQYYPMGIVQTTIILLSAFIRVFLRLRAERRIKEMAEDVVNVNVLRDNEWIENISSATLTPGDVFEVSEHTKLPCDAVVLSGTIIVNESSLTGEAMPIRKIAAPNNSAPYTVHDASNINSLFAGTLVSQAIPSHGQSRVIAVVLKTGITSEKGTLIHKILFPAPVSFIFHEHLKMAISILLIWGLVAFALSLYLMGRGNITSWFYGVFVMSEIFSPLLPAAFTINQSVCAARLRKKKILCIDLPRINLSGKVRIFCFDKTGTLTREGLEFYGGVVTPSLTTQPFEEREQDPLKMDPLIAMGIATCHAVTRTKDQYIGNPVDIESFNAMRWELSMPSETAYLDTLVPPSVSPNHPSSPVHILQRFEFVHARASQSVAVLDTATNKVHVFLKGSFERVKHLALPESIPTQYDAVAASYAQEGCYVLALAHRDMGQLGQDITMEEIKKMTRDEMEASCGFVGFVLFRNMLKHDTTEAIAALKGGDVRTVMITGDTALTGIFIARQCGMVAADQRVLLGDVKEDRVVWHDVDTEEQLDVKEVLKQETGEAGKSKLELAMTGKAFEALCELGEVRSYLLHTRMFARMTPNNKVDCVQLHMEKGVTAMCGDGGNDCGALRAAHVGMALSEAEASIVSPFSTSDRSIMQCVELLKQGRSALATSFANYKFLILYGECMAFWELIMFYFTVIAPQPIWITIDGFITTTMTFAITQAQPAKHLGPSRPTAKPLGTYTLASCLGVIFINFWFLVSSVAWLFQQDWFVCNEFDSSSIDSAKWWLLGDNYEAEVISLVIIFQFFNSGAIVNFGSVFRQSWWRNYILVFIWTCFFVSTSFLTLADPNPYSCIFRINCGSPSVLQDLGYPLPWWKIEPYNSPLGHNVLPVWFRWQLWGFILANCLVNIIWERVIVLWLGRQWAIRRNKNNPKNKRIMFKL
ncbi:hypothetical protein BDF14DRAFT_1730653 [Spinellus fusiger]|nr:hypothetical protein BDF14DRAFT_1730653 [Spinellus fusiger]